MARDPFKYFRIEARELLDGLGAGAMALASNPADGAAVGRLLRHAHTLKGAARVVRLTDVAVLAHAFEEMLEPFRAGGNPMPRETVDGLLRTIDAMSAHLETLSVAPGSAPAAVAQTLPASVGSVPGTPTITHVRAPTDIAPRPLAETPTHATLGTVRIDIADLDRLLEDVSVVSVQVERLRRELGELQSAQRGARALGRAAGGKTTTAVTALAVQLDTTARHFSAGVDHAARGLREAQEQIHALRLLPARSVFASLERAVFDAAGALGKEVELRTEGADQKLEAHVLAPVADALLHVVRNAVDHGLETPDARRAAGKPARGLIELSVQRRGSRVAIRARDDGRGVDLESVRRKALTTGRLSAERAAAFDMAGAVALLLDGGLSTKSEVTAISGRGIGLDVVRDVAARLKGTVQVSSEPGRGTTIELLVPASLSRLPALLVMAGGQVFSIPMTAVETTFRLDRAGIGRTTDGESVLHADEVLPYARLSTLVGAESASNPERVTALLVAGREGCAVISVDRLLGQAEILLRSLPPSLGLVELFMGTSMDADGDPQPMLDADGLVSAARLRRGDAMPAATGRPRVRILVIDDSLTTRMLEQSILESAGYEVALATSGEEGLAMARQQRYDLFITDVEMPGMNGFEFIAATRADPKLRETPGIVVSSLYSAADKARGAEAGARAYIVKGEFEQGRFLDTIRTLVD